MPAYAAQYWRQEEKKYVLPDQIIEAIDSCETEKKKKKTLETVFYDCRTSRSFGNGLSAA